MSEMTLSQRIEKNTIWSLSPQEIAEFRRQVRDGEAEEWRASVSYCSRGERFDVDVTGVSRQHCQKRLDDTVQNIMKEGKAVRVLRSPSKFVPSV